MGMGRHGGTQPEMWVAATELPRSPGHTFYDKLNQLLAEAAFDRRCEAMCAPY
jgi:transposase